MKNRLHRRFALTLALLLALLPMAAQAETPAAQPSMMTFTVGDFTFSSGGAEETLPLTAEISVGMEFKSLDDLRGAALISLIMPDSAVTLMGSIENDEIRARISGMETGILMPLQEVIDEIIIQSLLLGMTYDQLSPETLTALDEYLTALEAAFLSAEQSALQDAASLFDPLLEVWQEELELYPAHMNAVPAGEEEVTLFGETYLSKKYTYALDRVGEEEYDAFYEACHTSSYELDALSDADLDAAYDKLNELVKADYTALYGEEPLTLDDYLDSHLDSGEIWTDDGTLQNSGSGSLSEWDEDLPEDYAYSVQGTIWQIDEVSGILETYTVTLHAPDGDYQETYTFSGQLTDSGLKSESTVTGVDEYGDHYTDSAAGTISFLENGDFLYEAYTDWSVDSEEDDYDYQSQSAQKIALTGQKMTMDIRTDANYWGMTISDSIQGDFDLVLDPATGVMTGMEGRVTSETAADGEAEATSFSMSVKLGSLPAGELLTLPEKTINPMTADEAAITAFTEELTAALISAFGSLMPAPEAPPTVGGALMS